MGRLSLKAAETVEVDILGTVYTTVPLTRTRELAMEEISLRLAELKPGDFPSVTDANLASAELVCSIADQLLVPPEGKRKKASKVLLDAYLADEITFASIEHLLDDIAEEVGGRPT